MNPLTPITGPQSKQFSLNETDFKKVGRMLLVQAVGLFVTIGVPYLLKFTYTLKGQDYTPYVLVVVNALAELARRWLAQPPKV
jgi:hypothetical protein